MDVIEQRDALVTQLRASGDDALAALRAIDAADFDLGRYENGWTARQILAHVAAVEWTYPRLLDLPTYESAPAGTEVQRNVSSEVRARMDGYNARQVEKRANATVPDLIAEFERNRAATVAAIACADTETLARRVQSFGGMEGALIDVIAGIVIGHVGGHILDITGNAAQHRGNET